MMRERQERLRSALEDRTERTDGPVWAMPVILHIPKHDGPSRLDLLAAAATAAVALCFDERADIGGPWHEAVDSWLSTAIRKISRRARGAQWVAAGDVPGVTAEVGTATARALVPGPVDAVDPRIARLQIGGTDVPATDPEPLSGELPVMWVNAALGMTVGKAAAQVGHGSMLLAADLDVSALERWAARGFACEVREADAQTWAELQGSGVVVRDAGFTEVAPGSATVIAVR